MSSAIAVEKHEHSHTIIIDRETQRNALNEAVGNGICDALDAAESDLTCRAVVLTGRGDRAFCAGGDLKTTTGDSPFDGDFAEPRNFIVRLFRRMETCRLPIIARVNGAAVAGGLGLLCGCDIAIASDTAKFGTPEAGIGIFPATIFPFMQRVIPARKLMEIYLTADLFGAQEALEMGILNYVVPAAELDARVDAMVAKITSRSPTAVRLGKMGMHAMQDMVFDQALEYAQLMLGTMARTKDAAEGLASFRDKRAPKWTGK